MSVDIEYGNKLIADSQFSDMRADYITNNGDVLLIGYTSEKHYSMSRNKSHHLVRHLKYDSNWEWLMPVVEKIESIDDPHHGYFGVHISSNGCTIQATNLRTDKPMADPPHYFSDHCGDTKIEATWNAVVNFIQWYNKKEK